MTSKTLAVTEHGLAPALEALSLPIESAGTAAATHAGTTLLSGPITMSADHHYIDRQVDGLRLRSDGWVHSLLPAARNGQVPVFIHTHPCGSAAFSDRDDVVDSTLSREIERLTGARDFTSLIVAGTPDSARVIARRVESGAFLEYDKVRVVGRSARLHLRSPDSLDGEVFDRQIRALGEAGRDVLAELTVGVVGAGGTGSAVSEQLIRLGLRDLIVVDDDVITRTSPTRGYGSSVADLDTPKAEVIAELSRRIGLGGTVTPVTDGIASRDALGHLSGCDLIFGCTDNHSSRLVLNRFAYWHLVPLVDLGVAVSTDNGQFSGVHGRVTWVAPGTTCLLCRGRVDPTIASAERLDPKERRARRDEGYVPNLDDPAPSVVAYTTTVAGLAVAEVLHRLFELNDPSSTELLWRADLHQLRTNDVIPRDGCFCSLPDQWGAGYDNPHLGLVA